MLPAHRALDRSLRRNRNVHGVVEYLHVGTHGGTLVTGPQKNKHKNRITAGHPIPSLTSHRHIKDTALQSLINSYFLILNSGPENHVDGKRAVNAIIWHESLPAGAEVLALVGIPIIISIYSLSPCLVSTLLFDPSDICSCTARKLYSENHLAFLGCMCTPHQTFSPSPAHAPRLLSLVAFKLLLLLA